MSNLSNSTHAPGAMCGNDDSFKFRAYMVTYSVVFPVALLSNSAALIVLLRFTPTPRSCSTGSGSAARVLMTNLALSDAGFSLTLPLRLVYYGRGGHWDFPDWLCRCCVYAFYMNLYTSVLFLTALAALRCFAVLQPFNCPQVATTRRARCLCLAIWVIVAASSFPFLLTGTLWRQGHIRCFEPGGIGSWRRILILNYVAMTVGFLLPFLTIIYCYGSIILTLKTRQAARQAERRAWFKFKPSEYRSQRIVAVILAAFLLCFLPYHCVRTVHLHAVVALSTPHSRDCEVLRLLQKVLVVTLCLAASNSCINPLLYYFSGQTFRKAARASLRRVSFSSLGSLTKGRDHPMSQINQSSLKVCEKTGWKLGNEGRVAAPEAGIHPHSDV